MTDVIPAGDLDDDAGGELAEGKWPANDHDARLATRRGVVDATDATGSRVAAGG